MTYRQAQARLEHLRKRAAEQERHMQVTAQSHPHFSEYHRLAAEHYAAEVSNLEALIQKRF